MDGQPVNSEVGNDFIEALKKAGSGARGQKLALLSEVVGGGIVYYVSPDFARVSPELIEKWKAPPGQKPVNKKLTLVVGTDHWNFLKHI
jgi:hypothetical protein